MEQKIYDIWFSSLDIENKAKLDLLDKYNTKEIYELDLETLEEFEIEKKDIIKILNFKNLDDAHRDFRYITENDVKLISVRDESYPEKLNYIDNKPAFLYVRGNEKIWDNNSVGIVGCRNSTKTGENLARKIARELADKNINIISGLALGIDKYAHLGALDSGIGKTVAVLGCGIADDDMYPFQNMKVFERIIENGGAVVTEYPIGTKPEKQHFPARNRIISGLSDKVIVVEAKKRSGSLITAAWAVEQGKDVFAVPREHFCSKFSWD